ncbi:MAG: cupin domain-containing protein [Syntrophaceae bacterium]|nr:cupin domain-containing protein [Syntrophaceae bacterium]
MFTNMIAEKNAKEICKAIGLRIRVIRQKKRLTLDELAKRTGFAKSYISQIETMKREPPISTLTKIAYVLGVDVFFLISGETRQNDGASISIVKASDRKVIPRQSGSSAYTYEPINDKKLNRMMDGYIVTVGPEFPDEPLVHEGQEITYVLEGRHEFVYDGKTYLLEKGDCYCFESMKPHYARSLGNKPSKLLVVFSSKK